VIRNVCIHINNEQPLLADLYEIPTSADAGLVCTNVRSMDGKRPLFVDRLESTFFFPYHVIRFLEIPPGEVRIHQEERRSEPGTSRAATPLEEALARGDRLPVPVVIPAGAPHEPELDVELEIDEDFLRRVRDL